MRGLHPGTMGVRLSINRPEGHEGTAMPDSAIIKLPFFSKRRRLPRLPGQPKGTAYAIVWGACPQPKNAMCYIAELKGTAKAKLLAYVSTDGSVYRVDGPATAQPQTVPALAIARKEDGKAGSVYLGSKNGLRRIGGYLGSVRGAMQEDAPDSWSAGHPLPYREFLAALFLSYCVFPADGQKIASASGSGDIDMSFTKLKEPIDLFEGFQLIPLPDAIDAMLFRINAKQDPCGVERYAKRLFKDFNLTRLRVIAAISHMSLSRIERTNQFYVNFDGQDLIDSDLALVYGVETALNRLSRVLDVIGTSLAPISASPSEEACSLIDQRDLCAISDEAMLIVESEEPNPWMGGLYRAAQPGGEWDVRTYMAHVCEGMRTIVRLEYQIRYDAAAHCIGVHFFPPTASSMPSSLFSEQEGAWITPNDDTRRAMADEYAARMVIALATSAFASDLSISRAVILEEAICGRDEAVFSFERTAFLAKMLPRAASLASSPLSDGHASALIADAAADRYAMPDVEDDLFIKPTEDDRPLPKELQEMLLADTVRDIEVIEPADDPNLTRLNELRELEATDREKAASGIVALIEELQASCVEAELLADHPVSSQYCDSYTSRFLLGLNREDTSLRIHRVPDALYNAQFELTNMYMRGAMYDQALVEARKLLDMGRTCSSSHFALINILARLERWDELAEVARHGLSVAFERDSIGYFFYRLAYAYWNLGKRETALACYRMVPPGEGISGSAREEMRALVGEMGVEHVPSPDEAAARLRAEGIPVPPTPETVQFIAELAVRLTDGGFFFPASRCVFDLWRYLASDEAGAIHKSLLAHG